MVIQVVHTVFSGKEARLSVASEALSSFTVYEMLHIRTLTYFLLPIITVVVVVNYYRLDGVYLPSSFDIRHLDCCSRVIFERFHVVILF